MLHLGSQKFNYVTYLNHSIDHVCLGTNNEVVNTKRQDK